jgi:hypothetical protein
VRVFVSLSLSLWVCMQTRTLCVRVLATWLTGASAACPRMTGFFQTSFYFSYTSVVCFGLMLVLSTQSPPQIHTHAHTRTHTHARTHTQAHTRRHTQAHAGTRSKCFCLSVSLSLCCRLGVWTWVCVGVTGLTHPAVVVCAAGAVGYASTRLFVRHIYTNVKID